MKIIINFYWFIWNLISYKYNRKNPKVEKRISNRRLKICKHCPLLNKKGILVKLKGPRCSICGCFCNWKTLYVFEKCPDNPPKW